MDFGLMGYVRRKTYRLRFADDEFAGLEVVARPIPTGEYLGLLVAYDERPDPETASIVGWVGRLHGAFASALVEWNVEDEDGKPVPPTVEGLATLDHEFTTAVIRAYIDAVTGVSAPLEQPSSDGGPSLEESIPMEPLSPSPPS